jgi:hypothetical protein
VPNLGVVSVDDKRSFVIADIPGVIEGAAEGAGLLFKISHRGLLAKSSLHFSTSAIIFLADTTGESIDS